MVDGRYQGRGYGRAALLAILQLASRDKTRHLLPSYWPENSAVSLYESVGFRHLEERWGENDGEPVMVLDL